jgi:hypothetical protein
MAKEVTISERARMIQVGIVNRARSIADYVDELENMEKDMKLGGPQLELFRLCVRSIRADVNSLASKEERDA